MATRAEMDTLVSTNLTTTSTTITATEHRTVEKAMLEYTAGRIIATGAITIGDVDQTHYFTIGLGLVLPNANYIVVGYPVSYGYWNDDNDVNWCVTAKTNLNFTIYIGEYTTDNQSITFEWMAISTPQLLTTNL